MSSRTISWRISSVGLLFGLIFPLLGEREGCIPIPTSEDPLVGNWFLIATNITDGMPFSYWADVTITSNEALVFTSIEDTRGGRTDEPVTIGNIASDSTRAVCFRYDEAPECNSAPEGHFEGQLSEDENLFFLSAVNFPETGGGSYLFVRKKDGASTSMLNGSYQVSSILGKTTTPQGPVKIPDQSEWTDRGVAISPGTGNAWDVNLRGATSPTTVVKKNGTYFLYYVGSDGQRPDCGPAHRALGVATSTDGVHFEKYSRNPVITHNPNGYTCNEEGVFSAGATLDSNGAVVLYYSGCTTPPEELDKCNTVNSQVDCEGFKQQSNDGRSFGARTLVLDGSGDYLGSELFPVGTFPREDGEWFLYYIAKQISTNWDLLLVRGTDRNTYDPGSVAIVLQHINNQRYIRGGADPIWLDASTFALFITQDNGAGGNECDPNSWPDRTLQVRTGNKSDPYSLSSPVKTYNFGNGFNQATVFLDEESRTWFMYYLNQHDGKIYVKTAPVTYQSGAVARTGLFPHLAADPTDREPPNAAPRSASMFTEVGSVEFDSGQLVPAQSSLRTNEGQTIDFGSGSASVTSAGGFDSTSVQNGQNVSWKGWMTPGGDEIIATRHTGGSALPGTILLNRKTQGHGVWDIEGNYAFAYTWLDSEGKLQGSSKSVFEFDGRGNVPAATITYLDGTVETFTGSYQVASDGAFSLKIVHTNGDEEFISGQVGPVSNGRSSVISGYYTSTYSPQAPPMIPFFFVFIAMP
ncbi:MAG: hypothetical protein D6812_11185 [Deltaproteobacteria bacterium]|nr:MAG: hypothetical protein D6812_11185 [Deltaproteobacteria bacterium]